MAKYKITYEQRSQRIMEVEANSIEEAKSKYEDFDCINDYEDHGIDEILIDIIKIKDWFDYGRRDRNEGLFLAYKQRKICK